MYRNLPPPASQNNYPNSGNPISGTLPDFS
jgi:hypothetical protein